MALATLKEEKWMSFGTKYQGDWIEFDSHTTRSLLSFFTFSQTWQRNGIGITTWKNGAKYAGNWIQDQCTGKGVFTTPFGFEYEGEWRNDKKHGKGYCFFPNGSSYHGFWKHDQRHGEGVMKWYDGRYFRGNWKNDQRHGYGIFFTSSNGLIIEGIWKQNKLVLLKNVYFGLKNQLPSHDQFHHLQLQQICKLLCIILCADDFWYSDALANCTIEKMNLGFFQHMIHTLLHYLEIDSPRFICNPFFFFFFFCFCSPNFYFSNRNFQGIRAANKLGEHDLKYFPEVLTCLVHSIKTRSHWTIKQGAILVLERQELSLSIEAIQALMDCLQFDCDWYGSIFFSL